MASTEPDQDVTPALGEALAEPGVRRYRRKPSEVDAIQWTGGNLPAVRAFASGALGSGILIDGSLPLWTAKSRAVCHVERGDWVLREPDGSGFYPCERGVFAAAYEPVSRAAPTAALLGQRVRVKLDEHIIQEGKLLGFDEGGEIQIEGDDGFVWHGWPALEVTPVAGDPS